jgi:3'-phosphoadenosine 5'-phosphosulfate (PAPS) 3'-phosphatase
VNPVALDPLIAIARAAGAEILKRYVKTIASERKADGSPVTAADHAAEAVIVAGLAVLDPGVLIVAEELAERGDAPTVADHAFWCVDPLDGTKEFIAGTDEFVVCIARIEQGVRASATRSRCARCRPAARSRSTAGRIATAPSSTAGSPSTACANAACAAAR